MEKTFELELLAREFQHKFAILGANLATKYVESQTTGDIKIPSFMVEQQKMQYVTDTIHSFLSKGIFDEEYEKAWEEVKDKIPDNYSTLM